VLQYLPDPLQVVSRLSALQPEFFIIDRTPISTGERMTFFSQSLTRDRVHQSYPLQVIPEALLGRALGEAYVPFLSFTCADEPIRAGGQVHPFRGIVWRRVGPRS
jgi:hypothetical protein